MYPASIRPVVIALVVVLLGPCLMPAIAADAPRTDRRCGWFENPTPGEASLTDREATWVIATQGGHEASGDWPDFSDAQWVETNNGHHGYGCACLSMRSDPATHEVLSILKATARPLAICRRDKLLHEPAHDSTPDD